MLDELNFGRAEPCVRVNSVDSGLVEEDLKVTLSAERLPQALMLPKVENEEHISWASTRDHSDSQMTTQRYSFVPHASSNEF